MTTSSHDDRPLVKALFSALDPWVGCALTLKTIAAVAMVLVAELRRRGLRLDPAVPVGFLVAALQAHGHGDLLCAPVARNLSLVAARDVWASGQPICSHCGERAAACVGRYEAMERDEPACGECCGHGCEDGACRPIAPAAGGAA